MMSTAVATATSSTASVSPPPTLSNSDGRGVDVRQRVLENGTAVSSHAVPDEDGSKRDPLPADLRRILVEVARSGLCKTLSWNKSSRLDAAPLEETMNSTTTTAAACLPPQTPQKSSGPLVVARRRNQAATCTYNPRSSSPLHTVPARKKRRNGVYSMSRRRHGGSTKTTTTSSTTATSRKRPLFLIKTTSSSVFSGSSVGSSGRTSGSEQEGDSTQYECDSEGTSATTNSEVSFERKEHQLRNNNLIAMQASAAARHIHTSTLADKTTAPRYTCLKEAVRVALALVLDHAYRYRGGYKLSPAEVRRNATENEKETGSKSESDSTKHSSDFALGTMSKSAEIAFQKRRNRLLALLETDDNGGSMGISHEARKESDESDWGSSKAGSVPVGNRRLAGNAMDGPPFTIQRVAEVLVSPERYYTQTHKLCNCLEKLLLITSSSSAFGGSTGGGTSQSRQEERELAALANEKGRARRLRRKASSSSDDLAMDVHDLHDSHGVASLSESNTRNDTGKGLSPLKTETDGTSTAAHGHATNHGPLHGSKEYLEAAARASLRTKFDHVAIDAHAASASVEREHGGRPSSPPPPTQNRALQTHAAGLVRQHLQEHGDSLHDPMPHNHHMIARPPSPILFSSGTDTANPPPSAATSTTVNPLSPNSTMQLIQMHHSAALATLSGTPLDLVIEPGPSTATASVAALLEADPGRSSASNSDVDSESDDVSLDDSASDRSDGSDSGSGTVHYEPFTAARVVALNRMQQQQQRLHSRVLSALNATGTAGGSGTHFGNQEGFRPPADSEYQSGDSIDSMIAEDSGGSDSSSSDVAD